MAGDFGQIIDPYRVAPAQGDLQDYGMFAARDEQTQALRVAQALAAATRQFLAQQNGLPQGVDPNAVQGYQIAGNTDKRAQAQEGRSAQDHQSKYDFANKFVGALPEQADPYTRALQIAGGPFGAEGLTQALGGQFTRQGDLTNRSAMNDADNIAAQKQLETKIRMETEAAVAEQSRKQGVESQQEQKIKQAIEKGSKTGDWSDFYSLAPNAVGSPTMYDREMQSKESAAKAVAEQKRQEDIEKAKALKPSPVGTIQKDPRVQQAQIQSQFGNKSPEEIVKQVVSGTNSFGGDSRFKMVREMYPELYNREWAAQQDQLREQEVQRRIQALINPPANSMQRIGGY